MIYNFINLIVYIYIYRLYKKVFYYLYLIIKLKEKNKT